VQVRTPHPPRGSGSRTYWSPSRGSPYLLLGSHLTRVRIRDVCSLPLLVPGLSHLRSQCQVSGDPGLTRPAVNLPLGPACLPASLPGRTVRGDPTLPLPDPPPGIPPSPGVDPDLPSGEDSDSSPIPRRERDRTGARTRGTRGSSSRPRCPSSPPWGPARQSLRGIGPLRGTLRESRGPRTSRSSGSRLYVWGWVQVSNLSPVSPLQYCHVPHPGTETLSTSPSPSPRGPGLGDSSPAPGSDEGHHTRRSHPESRPRGERSGTWGVPGARGIPPRGR
jgi:hypothetical protein